MWTEADVLALEAAIAEGRGVRSMTLPSGESVSFSSIAEMLQLLSAMKNEVQPSGRYRFLVTSKGL